MLPIATLSGGEGAQLICTMLGAAIAYQFGGDRDGDEAHPRSSCFITIDGTFSKLDEAKSGYLLQLCRSLGLQLMVVTPQTSIQLLEREAAVIHWVTRNKHDARTSVVRDIAILDYRQDAATRAAICCAGLGAAAPDWPARRASWWSRRGAGRRCWRCARTSGPSRSPGSTA